MKYIVNPEDYKTKEAYTQAIDTLIYNKEAKMKDCRMRLLQLNNSALGALYILNVYNREDIYGTFRI